MASTFQLRAVSCGEDGEEVDDYDRRRSTSPQFGVGAGSQTDSDG
jgi:hypothetical protein